MQRNARFLQVILERSPAKLSQTRLLKYAYMVDLTAWRVLGHPVSRFKYIRYKHGPFSQAFYQAKDYLLASNLADVEELTTQDGYDTSLIGLIVNDPSEPDDFSAGELYIIDEVISKFNKVGLQEFVMKTVYNTGPMKKAEYGKELRLRDEKLEDADRFGGVSLETVLDSRKAFERGEGIPIEEVKRNVLESLE